MARTGLISEVVKKLVASLLAGGIVVAPTARGEEWLLRPDGIGPLKVGMSFNDVRRELGAGLERTPAAVLASPDCDYLPVPGRPGVNLMFIDDVLMRVDVTAGEWQTDRGIRPGSATADVKAAYRRLQVEPREFTETGSYLTFRPVGSPFAVRFEASDEGWIDTIYAGDAKAVGYAEACL